MCHDLICPCYHWEVMPLRAGLAFPFLLLWWTLPSLNGGLLVLWLSCFHCPSRPWIPATTCAMCVRACPNCSRRSCSWACHAAFSANRAATCSSSSAIRSSAFIALSLSLHSTPPGQLQPLNVAINGVHPSHPCGCASD